MKYFLTTLLLFQNYLLFGNFFITDFPKTDQLYQRNNNDSSKVEVKGVFNAAYYSKVTLKILKDNVLFYQSDTVMTATSGYAYFDFNPNILAGKFNYTFLLLVNDTQEARRVERVSSGDIYLFYGQSNSLGLTELDTYIQDTNPFIKILTINEINNNQGSWQRLVDNNLAKYFMGQFPLEVGKHIIANNQYPVGLIQAAVSGSSVFQLTQTCGSNPPCAQFPFDRMLRQLHIAGVQNTLKYVFFRQGENECTDPSAANLYETNFGLFYNQLNNKIPSLEKIFLLQLNLLTYTVVESELVRDFQRRAQDIHPKIVSYASVGINGFDGVHYTSQGHTKASQDLSKLVSYTIYNTITDKNAESPAIKKLFKSADGTKLILKFQEGQNMMYPADSLVNSNMGGQILRTMKEFMYLDNLNTQIVSGIADKNYVTLSLTSNTVNPLKMTYLPPFFGDDHSIIYNGVNLKNSLGMRALTFARKSIFDALQVPTLTGNVLNATTSNQMIACLNWTPNMGTKHHIEKSIDGGVFTEIKTVNVLNFNDSLITNNHSYSYRIWSENDNSESERSTILSLATTCPENLNLSLANALITSPLKAINTVTLIGSTMLPRLNTQAGKSIILNPGLLINGQNTVFTAQIEGCN